MAGPPTPQPCSPMPWLCSGAARSRVWTMSCSLPTRRDDSTEICVSIEEDLAEVDLDLGKHTEAAERLDRLVAECPLRERLVAALMTALYRGGRHAEALSVYQRHARLLGDELGSGAEPAAGRARRADPGPRPGAGTPAASTTSPCSGASQPTFSVFGGSPSLHRSLPGPGSGLLRRRGGRGGDQDAVPASRGPGRLPGLVVRLPVQPSRRASNRESSSG